jgi:aspartyl-tRNA(Asn)/glutamyl-tRNA(Gln) amidotransferase subunit C
MPLIMDKSQVLKLASLSRLAISDPEAEKLSGEIGAILKYVGEIQEISGGSQDMPKKDNFPVYNVMRDDGEGHTPGIFTEKILNEAPAREGEYIKVKKILG